MRGVRGESQAREAKQSRDSQVNGRGRVRLSSASAPRLKQRGCKSACRTEGWDELGGPRSTAPSLPAGSARPCWVVLPSGRGQREGGLSAAPGRSARGALDARWRGDREGAIVIGCCRYGAGSGRVGGAGRERRKSRAVGRWGGTARLGPPPLRTPPGRRTEEVPRLGQLINAAQSAGHTQTPTTATTHAVHLTCVQYHHGNRSLRAWNPWIYIARAGG